MQLFIIFDLTKKGESKTYQTGNQKNFKRHTYYLLTIYNNTIMNLIEPRTHKNKSKRHKYNYCRWH